MGLMEMADNLGQKMKWYDFSLLKLSVFLFALFLIGIWEGFRNAVLSISPYWYLTGFVVISIPLIKKMFMD